MGAPDLRAFAQKVRETGSPNLGLAAQGPVLPAGVVLRFPDPPLPEPPRTRAWD